MNKCFLYIAWQFRRTCLYGNRNFFLNKNVFVRVYNVSKISNTYYASSNHTYLMRSKNTNIFVVPKQKIKLSITYSYYYHYHYIIIIVKSDTNLIWKGFFLFLFVIIVNDWFSIFNHIYNHIIFQWFKYEVLNLANLYAIPHWFYQICRNWTLFGNFVCNFSVALTIWPQGTTGYETCLIFKTDSNV